MPYQIRVVSKMSELSKIQVQKAVPSPTILPSKSVLHRAAMNNSPTHEVPPIVHGVLRSPGQPLDAATRAFMEPRFGHDFSNVRVHTDAKAVESARAVNALAYTVGDDVVLGVGQHTPWTNAGQQLMAHELTHVVQQQGSAPLGKLSQGDTNVQHGKEAHQIVARQELPGPMSLPPQAPMTMAPWAPSERGQVALSIALGEVGVREHPTGSNRGPCPRGATRGCVDAYTGGRAEPWCAHFVSWAFEQTGSSPFGHIAGVNALRGWGRSMGWYFTRQQVENGTVQPLAGDILTMPRYEGVGPQRRLVGGHTGFVIRYDAPSRLLETVEGNTSDAVRLRTRTLASLDGFIRIGS
jgi:hypothetical protein